MDDRTFTIRLKEPFNYVEFLLGGSNGVVGAIMREKEALTDPFTPIKEIHRLRPVPLQPRASTDRARGWSMTGSTATCRARSRRAVSPAARWSRSTGSSWCRSRIPSTAYAAIRNGEVDFLDGPALDLLPTVADNPNIVVGEVWPIETYAVLRFNHLYPPFNNVKARQAVAHAVSQRDYMAAAYGDPKYWRECYAFWVCGSPNGTEIGSDAYRKPDLDLARSAAEGIELSRASRWC